MNLLTYLKSYSKIELALLIVFIIYIVFPISTPPQLAFLIDNPLGILAIFVIAVALFFYTHPIVSVVFLLVGYELLRRSTNIVNRVAMIRYVPSEEKRAQDMIRMNPPEFTTLEEQIVSERAPVDVSRPIVYQNTTFKPVYDKVRGASLI